MSEKSERAKDNIGHSVERKFDELHGVVDVITGPLAPIDGVIHGTTARGVANWLTDKHPEKVDCPKKGNREECQERGGGPAPPPAGTQTNTGTQTNSGTNNGIQSGSTGSIPIPGINFNKY